MKIFLIAILITCPCISFSQTALKLSGKVVDVQTKEPLQYASITIKSKPIGTVTNADGEFEFHLTTLYTQDTLMISMLGYNSFSVKVLDIKDPKNLMVRLAFKPTQLKEVVVVANKITPQEIIKRAFENIKNNNPAMPYRLRGFYREMHEEGDRSVMLTEAALDVYDQGHRAVHGARSSVKEKVNLRNSRTSKNYRNNLLNKTVVEKWNLVVSALRNNPVKYRDPNIKRKIADKVFRLDSVIYFNDRLVYVISFFSYISRFPNFERKNTLCVDAENFAIYKYGWEEYAKEGKYSEPPWRLSKDSFYFYKRKKISTIYEFGDYQGKMFLKYFDEKAYYDIYNSKEDSVEFESLDQVVMVITEIMTDVKMEEQETMALDQSIGGQVKKYDPSFWSNYDETKLVPLTKKQIKDLELEMSLEEQFKMQGIKK
jgi:hypothetical protein